MNVPGVIRRLHEAGEERGIGAMDAEIDDSSVLRLIQNRLDRVRLGESKKKE